MLLPNEIALNPAPLELRKPDLIFEGYGHHLSHNALPYMQDKDRD